MKINETKESSVCDTIASNAKLTQKDKIVIPNIVPNIHKSSNKILYKANPNIGQIDIKSTV